MMPRSGQIHVSNAAFTITGRAIQMMKRASLGKIPANIANKQPISLPPTVRGQAVDSRADGHDRLHSVGVTSRCHEPTEASEDHPSSGPDAVRRLPPSWTRSGATFAEGRGHGPGRRFRCGWST